MRVLICDESDNEITIVEVTEMFKYTGDESDPCIILYCLDSSWRYECYDPILVQPCSFVLSQSYMKLLKDGYVDLSDYLWIQVDNDEEENTNA